VQKNVIFKGEVIDVLKNNITEVHGFFQKEQYVGTLGGQLK
jgi:hypothetical protein